MENFFFENDVIEELNWYVYKFFRTKMELVKLAFKLGSKLSKCLVFSFIKPNKILIYSSQKNVLVNYHAYEDIRLKHWFSR